MGKYAKTPSVFQMEMTECGAASLCMVLAYYGCHVPLEQMRIETGVSRDGCNMKGIKLAAQKYGMEVHAYRRETEKLRQIEPPCIIHWNFNHFVVFEGFKGRYAYINDPAIGRRKLTQEEFDECFTGIVMTLKKTDQFNKSKKKSTIISFAVRRLQGYYGILFQLLYIGLLLVVPSLVLPLLSQVYIDDVLGNGYRDWIMQILLFMGGCIVLKESLSYYRSLLLEKLKAKMTLLSGKAFLYHIFRLPISFFDQRYTGDLVNRMVNNQNISKFFAGDLAEMILNMITACFYLIILILYSPVLTAIGLVKVTACVAGILLSAKALKDDAIKLQMSAGNVNGAVSAGLSITDSIKASGMEMEYANRILGYQAKYASFEQELMRRQQILNVIPDAAGKIVDVLLLLAGGLLVMHGKMTIGMLVAYNSLYDSFCDPVDRLTAFFHGFQRLRSNISRVEDIEKHEQSVCFLDKKDGITIAGKLKGNIELTDVSFGYSVLQPPAVEHFNLLVRSGETVALVGASGCGKSTIAKIIGGLYRPWKGKFSFDGIEQERIPPQALSNSVATVSQNIYLFSGSIRDNLTMWDSTVLEADIEEAAKDACIYDFIMQLPGGYDYRLDEDARNISGGQRQRLEIARALAKKPSILIMDEATSALDPLIEKKIMDNIRRRGCTCVLVAHRLSTIRDCSQIVVMKQGTIVERGTHLQLMKANGYYASLMNEEYI